MNRTQRARNPAARRGRSLTIAASTDLTFGQQPMALPCRWGAGRAVRSAIMPAGHFINVSRMLTLLKITNDPEVALSCESLAGVRIFVDLEINGKVARQAGRDTVISGHSVADVAAVRRVVKRSELMVRINPWFHGSVQELESVLAHKPDWVMLPMFRGRDDLEAFVQAVGGRAKTVALLETKEALDTVPQWIGLAGLDEVYLGLNDLHLALRCAFMFEPLAMGWVDRVALAAREAGKRFGFGGMARLSEGLIPGQAVLGEHVRLGSQAVILSRTFHRPGSGTTLEDDVKALREAEARLHRRSAEQIAVDQQQVKAAIEAVAAQLRGQSFALLPGDDAPALAR
jgi:HpcH/HpaI aldolase/citrate lyase family